MLRKKLFLFIFALLVIILPLSVKGQEPVEKKGDIYTFQKLIIEKTPAFISEPLISSINAIEGWRLTKAIETHNEFFLFILKHKLIFYSLVILFIFFIFRSIISLIF